MTASAASASIPILVVMRYRDVAAAIEWLCTAFGFERHKIVPDTEGKISRAELKFGNGVIMVGPAQKPEFRDRGVRFGESRAPEKQSCYLVVADVDAHYARAKDAGAQVVQDIDEQIDGGRGYKCRDLEGHIWSFGTYDPWQKRPVPAANMQTVAEAGSKSRQRSMRVSGVPILSVIVLAVAAGVFYVNGRQPSHHGDLSQFHDEAFDKELQAMRDLLSRERRERMAAELAANEIRNRLAQEHDAKHAAERAAKEARDQLVDQRRAREFAEHVADAARQNVTKAEQAREAAEHAAKEARDRLTQEQSARPDAERKAEEDRQAAERAANEARDRLAQEQSARRDAERKAEEDRQAAERTANEARDRLAQEQSARRDAERKAERVRNRLEQVRHQLEQERTARRAAERAAEQAGFELEQVRSARDLAERAAEQARRELVRERAKKSVPARATEAKKPPAATASLGGLFPKGQRVKRARKTIAQARPDGASLSRTNLGAPGRSAQSAQSPRWPSADEPLVGQATPPQ